MKGSVVCYRFDWLLLDEHAIAVEKFVSREVALLMNIIWRHNYSQGGQAKKIGTGRELI